MDNLERFTLQAREVLRQAQSEAARLHHAEVTPEHIAIALGGNQRAMSLAILREMNVAVPRLQTRLRETIGRGSLAAQRIAPLSPRFQRTLDLAVSEARVFGDQVIGTQHLLLGVIREGGDAKQVLADAGVSLYGVHKLMRGLGIHDGDQLPTVDLNQTPIMRSQVARAVRAVPIRPSLVFLGLLAFVALMGVLAWLLRQGSDFMTGLTVTLFVLGGWIVSVCLHEFGHAAVAYLGGDSTVVNKGYLTLNPLKYTHRLLSIVFPILILIIGGIPLPGGAVYVDRSMIRSRRMLSLMSAAGVLMQLALILVMLVPYLVFSPAGAIFHPAFWGGYAFLMYLNILGIIINLLPIPGIDGFGIIMPYLPYRVLERIAPYMMYGPIILFILFFLPPFAALISWITGNLATLVGINLMHVSIGYSFFPHLRR